jgi:hypothetical protein
MTIQELQEKYNLEKGDFWKHQQSGQWIIAHDGVEKIAVIEEIQLVEWDVLNSTEDLCRFKITMQMRDAEGIKRRVTTIGEADRKNCKSQYLGAMAEKRGIDRCVLKLINAYQYGVSSDVEADDFAKSRGAEVYEIKEVEYTITDDQKDTYQELLNSDYYKGAKAKMNEWWGKLKTTEQAEEGLKQMLKQVNAYNEKKAKKELESV